MRSIGARLRYGFCRFTVARTAAEERTVIGEGESDDSLNARSAGPTAVRVKPLQGTSETTFDPLLAGPAMMAPASAPRSRISFEASGPCAGARTARYATMIRIAVSQARSVILGSPTAAAVDSRAFDRVFGEEGMSRLLVGGRTGSSGRCRGTGVP